MCCTIKSSFLLTLEKLAKQRDRFDYVVVETTGLADPGPVVESLWVDEELESNVFLDSVVAVVDAKNLGKQVSAGGGWF